MYSPQPERKSSQRAVSSRAATLACLFAATTLTACVTVGDALLSVIPGPRATEYKVDPKYDAAAKALTPEPGQSLVYVILDTQRDKCGYVDVWVGEKGLGRVFEQEYLYASVTPGSAELKLRDTRADWKARQNIIFTTTAPIELQPDAITYLVIRPKRDRPCLYKDLNVWQLPAASGRALLEQRLLSKSNTEGFFARGMKLTGGATVVTQRDYCDGRTIAAAHFGDLPNPWYCRYAEKPLLYEE